MNPNWTDFEKYVFRKLSDIERDLATLKGRAAAWGAVAGAVTVLAGEVIVKVWAHSP